MTGGYVVRDPSLPDLAGRYLFADFYAGQVRTLRYSYSIPGDTPRGLAITQLSSFGEDAAGPPVRRRLRRRPGVPRCSRAPPREPRHSARGDVHAPDLHHRAARRSVAAVRGRARRHDPARQGRRDAPRRPFLDISALVLPEGEQGLLSMAFAPDYATSKRFYVFYTDKDGNNRIEEFRRYTSDRASRASRRLVLRIEHPTGRTTTAASSSSVPTATCTPPPAIAAAGVDPRTTAQNLGLAARQAAEDRSRAAARLGAPSKPAAGIRTVRLDSGQPRA